MNKKRLLKLADLLDRVPAKKFYMGTWGDASRLANKASEVRCATRACALGWATVIPEFAKLGLQLKAPPEALTGVVYFGNKIGLRAAMKLFQINFRSAQDLFIYGNSTPKQKASEIRAFVRGDRHAV